MKELVFLPDREGRDELTSTAGFVRIGAEGAALSDLVSRFVLPEREAVRTDVTVWRAILALTLLCDAWPDAGCTVSAMTVDSTASLFAAWVLSARPEEKRRDALHLILLEREGQRRLLGIADPHTGLTLPATPTDFSGLLPARAAWYDADGALWRDPVPYLNADERAILLARLTMMELDSPEAEAFKADLSSAEASAVDAIRTEDADALRALSIRMQAICGLTGFDALSVREEHCVVREDHPLVRLYSAVDVRYASARACSTWLWEGQPFARSSAALGLTDAFGADQEALLNAIEPELLLLSESSVRWNRQCAEALFAWLNAQDSALLPQVRAQAELLHEVQMNHARQVQTTVSLTWPWDASSGAIRYLLRETLGEDWLSCASNPFSDRLTKLTAHVLGDNALQHGCACADGVLLPPVSAELAACLSAAEDGAGLAADMLRFEPREDGGITASFLLRAKAEVHMTRVYSVEEILVLSEADSPCVAVWPCVPMERWKAYHVFVRGGAVEVGALRHGEWATLSAPDTPDADTPDTPDVRPAQPWRCLHTDAYPGCLVLHRDGQCLGALPNALPRLDIKPSADALAAIDLGSSATAVSILLDGKPISAQAEHLTRLLVTPQEMPADDFLLSLTPSDLTPSSVALIGDGDELFTDGYVYAVTHFDAMQAVRNGLVCTALKWRRGERFVRARKLLLHQVMLGASLTAMMAGAKSIRWRVTIADEMGDEGRQTLLDMMEELSAAVARETGLPLTETASVTWAEEAVALHACLCAEGGMKGTFAVLDIGGGSTKLHLWMQGRKLPVSGAMLLMGTSTMLLNVLSRNPGLLHADFADCGNDDLIRAVDALCDQFALAGEHLADADKALLMLDALLDEYRQPMTQHLYARFNQQRPTCLQGILLEMYAAAMFCIGLMLEDAGADSTVSHLFPGDLTVCLTGRGAWLLDTLTPQLRNGLQRIAHVPMALRHPVRTLTVRPSPLPALGVARGMALLRDTGITADPAPIRTRRSFTELMQNLLHSLYQCYPAHMWMLHPGLFDAGGHLTPAGEDTVRRLVSQCYGDGEDIPLSVMQFVSGLQKETLMPTPLFPGE